MQDSKPFTAQPFIKAATEEMQKRAPHPVEQVEAIMRKIESSPVLTEIEKEILFSHIQDGSQYEAPLPLSIAKDDDGHFCIAIDGRKWKIYRHGIIGINETERREFADAAKKAAGCELEFTTDIEVTVPYGRHSYLLGRDHEYKKLLASRGSTDKSLGQIAYEYFQSSDALRGESVPMSWDELPKDGPVCAAWECLGAACYHSAGSWPDDIEKTIQVLASRRRLQLLKDTGRFGLKEGTEFAVFLNEIAGPATKV